MSGHLGDLGDGSEEEDSALPLRRLETWVNPGNVEVLPRPALPGRKTHRGWYREALRGRQDGGRDATNESSSNSDHGNLAEAPRSSRPNSGTEDRDQFWAEVRSGASQTVTENPDEEEEEAEGGEEGQEEDDAGEGASGVREVRGQTVSQALLLLPAAVAVGGGDRRTSRREKNRARCLRRRQRKRERRHQQQESQKSSTAEPSSSSSSSSSSEEDDPISEGLLCAVCLDVYFCPYTCHPCNHTFCEPCLRTLAKNCPANTPCPLCRTTITHVFFQKELNQTARTFFPKEYLSRKQNFQKAACAKWPLPSCRKLFRMFGGFPRQWSPIARRRFPVHGGTFRVDPLELEELGERSAAGWRLDMDMVIIYIYSVNWIIGFIILCLLGYIFLPAL